MKDLLLYVRADEAKYREVNQSYVGYYESEYRPESVCECFWGRGEGASEQRVEELEAGGVDERGGALSVWWSLYRLCWFHITSVLIDIKERPFG
jgi:hypothetical protein